KNQCMNIGVNNTYSTAIADNYANNPYQNRTALFVSYKIAALKNKLMFTASVREELMNGKALPFTYSAGSDVKIKKWLSAKVSFSKLHRVATLNDLYWVPGGNLNLKPEEGFSQDASLKLHLEKKEKLALSIDGTLFNRNTTNQIVWLPSNGFWTPQNMVDVWSRGVESVSSVRVERTGFKIKLSLLTNYVLATNQASKSENDASVGKQLIYVPRYSGHAKIQAEYKGFLLSYVHSYTGYRFTSTDNSQYLSPFYLANIYLAKSIKIKEHQLSVFVQIDNVFNEQYQVVSVRAMPMRYYQCGLSIQINKPNKIKK
ncbi:MAG: TonB-dependent receptor domain-containing protein, partial [Flavobacteriales bacterium]